MLLGLCAALAKINTLLPYLLHEAITSECKGGWELRESKRELNRKYTVLKA